LIPPWQGQRKNRQGLRLGPTRTTEEQQGSFSWDKGIWIFMGGQQIF
jgi:hypothetical protein